MTRILLRYFNAPLLALIVAIGIAIQTSLFAWYPFNYLQPDVVLLVVIWVALKRSFFEGGVLTLIIAQFAEIHSGAPSGLYLTCYMGIFLTTRVLNLYLMLTTAVSLVGLTLFASIYWKLWTLGILHMMELSDNQWRHTFSLLLPGAVMEGIVGIWVYRWLDRFDWLTYKSERARKLLDEELELEEEGL